MDARKNLATPILNPQVLKIGQNSIKKQITKSSEHKPEDTSGKAKTDLLYRSIFKSKVPEEKTKNLASKTIINDEKPSFEISNEKSLTIPNESSFRDEKLDNKIKKNILDFSKTSTGSKKTYPTKDPQLNSINTANSKFPEKIENILMLSDSFARYPLNFDKEKKNILTGKTTPNKRSHLEEEKKGHFQPLTAKNYQGVSSSISTVKTLIKSIEKRNEADQQNQNINKGVNIEQEALKNSQTNEQFSNKSKNPETEQIFKKNSNQPPKMNDSKKKNETSKKNSEDLSVKDPKKEKDYGPFHEKAILTNSETFEMIKGKKIEYYLKNGIFEPLIIENSESGLLFEILEKVNFHYFVCESIREQRDEVKLFLTASNHYKTSKKILLLSACRKILFFFEKKYKI